MTSRPNFRQVFQSTIRINEESISQRQSYPKVSYNLTEILSIRGNQTRNLHFRVSKDIVLTNQGKAQMHPPKIKIRFQRLKIKRCQLSIPRV